MVVGAPVDDGLLDGLWLHVFGKGSVGECGELVVGGEAESDELTDGELVNVGTLLSGEECAETKAFLESDDAILNLERAIPQAKSHQYEDDGHDDPPEENSPVIGPVVNGDVDGEDDVEKENG